MHGPLSRRPDGRHNNNLLRAVTENHDDILQQYLAGKLPPATQSELLTPARPESSTLLVACAPGDYSASAIAKAVEDCDTQLLWLSVTGMRTENGRIIVGITADARTTGGLTRSLERYGYEVIYARGSEGNIEQREAIDRINELIHYLEI